MKHRSLKLIATSVLSSFAISYACAQNRTEIEFYYPVAVSGAITATVDSLIADFEQENPDIDIKQRVLGS